MCIRQLHYFMALGKYLNYKVAANAINIAPSGLSQQIAELEYELGFKLFQKDGKGLALTAAGVELMQRLPEIFKLMDQAVALMQDEHENPDSEILHIGFETPVAPEDMAVFISEFRKNNPNVFCLVNQYKFEGLSAALKNGSVDIGFFLMPSKGFGRTLEFQTVATDDLVLVIRRELVEGKDISISNVVSSRPLFCLEKSAGGTETLLGLFHEMQIVPNIYYCSRMDELICNVESGLGCAILPKRFVSSVCDPAEVLSINLAGFDRGNLCVVAATRMDNPSSAVLRFLSSLPHVESHCAGCRNYNCYRKQN